MILDRSSVAPEWALLGEFLELRVRRFGRVLAHRIEGGSWLAANPDGGELLAGPDSVASHAGATPRGQASRLRERFTGRQVDGLVWELELPKEWVEIGEPVSILYQSDKINGGGTGRSEHFIHEFHTGGAALRSGSWLAIQGRHIRVDAAGVRN